MNLICLCLILHQKRVLFYTPELDDNSNVIFHTTCLSIQMSAQESVSQKRKHSQLPVDEKLAGKKAKPNDPIEKKFSTQQPVFRYAIQKMTGAYKSWEYCPNSQNTTKALSCNPPFFLHDRTVSSQFLNREFSPASKYSDHFDKFDNMTDPFEYSTLIECIFYKTFRSSMKLKLLHFQFLDAEDGYQWSQHIPTSNPYDFQFCSTIEKEAPSLLGKYQLKNKINPITLFSHISKCPAIKLETDVKNTTVTSERIENETNIPLITNISFMKLEHGGTDLLLWSNEMIHVNIGGVKKIDLNNLYTKLPNLIVQLCLMLYELHEEGFVHSDIKPSNIVAKKNTNEFHIIDYGSLMFRPHLRTEESMFSTQLYESPESFLQANYGAHNDMWSFGLVLIAVLIQLNPNMNDQSLIMKLNVEEGSRDDVRKGMKLIYHFYSLTRDKKRLNGQIPAAVIEAKKRGCLSVEHCYESSVGRQDMTYLDLGYPKTFLKWKSIQTHPFLGADFVNLIEGLLQINPETRLTAKQVLQHPFITKHMSEVETKFQQKMSSYLNLTTGDLKSQSWIATINQQVGMNKSSIQTQPNIVFQWLKQCIPASLLTNKSSTMLFDLLLSKYDNVFDERTTQQLRYHIRARLIQHLFELGRRYKVEYAIVLTIHIFDHYCFLRKSKFADLDTLYLYAYCCLRMIITVLAAISYFPMIPPEIFDVINVATMPVRKLQILIYKIRSIYKEIFTTVDGLLYQNTFDHVLIKKQRTMKREPIGVIRMNQSNVKSSATTRKQQNTLDMTFIGEIILSPSYYQKSIDELCDQYNNLQQTRVTKASRFVNHLTSFCSVDCTKRSEAP